MELELSSEQQQNRFVWEPKSHRKGWTEKLGGFLNSVDGVQGVIMDTPISSVEKGQNEDVGQLKRQFSKTASKNCASAIVENEVVADGTSSSTRKSSELLSETPGFKPPPARLKLNERRSKCFQRAFSFNIVERPEEKVVERPSRSGNNQEMEMTYVENDNEENESDVTTKMSHSDITTNNLRDDKKGVDVDSGTLSSSNKDSGIVCSDEDLRFILTEVSQSRRLTAEAKREKMKSNRSLSLDSSFFKLHMKRLQADSPAWLSRILSQREKSTTSGGGNGANVSGCVGNSGSATTATDESSTSPLISPSSGISNNLSRKRSSCKKPEVSPATITEDTTSLEEDSSSRRESNVSCGSDDERSLLLINNSESPVVSVKTCGTISEITKTTPDFNSSEAVASKVVWNESSVVDAEVLGTAIEFYLTSVNTQKPAGTDTCRPDIEKEHHGHSTNVVSAPVVSTLKGLFVK